MAKLNKTTKKECWRGFGGKGTSFTTDAISNLSSHSANLCRFFQKLKFNLPYDSAIPLLGRCLKDLTAYSTDTCSLLLSPRCLGNGSFVLIAALSTTVKKWKKKLSVLQMTKG